MITKPSLSILIVEHDDTNFILIREYLCDCEFNLIRCNNGSEIVEHVKTNDSIKLVLIDLFLTDNKKGCDVTTIIKSIKPYLPVILHTAYLFSKDKNDELLLEYDDCILKPYSMSVFCNTIKKHIFKNDYQTEEISKD
jgi:CheY-like chemotaxis protein